MAFTQTPITAFIGKDPDVVEAYLKSRGLKRATFVSGRFMSAAQIARRQSGLDRQYIISDTSNISITVNSAGRIDSAILTDNPDSGFMKSLQSPIVTKLLTTAVIGALTAGTAVGSTTDMGMTPLTAISPGDAMDLTDFTDVAIDQSDAFNPFNFTDGESTAAWSDVQNVDYGFPAYAVTPNTDFADNPFQAVDPGQNPDVNYNTTSESAVSDFGSVNDPGSFINENAMTIYKDIKGLPLTKPAAAPKQPQSSVRNLGGGISSPKFGFWTPTQARPAVTASTPDSSTAIQRETSQIRNFFGQLAPGEKGTGVPVWLFVAGGALIVWGLVA